MSTTTSTSTSRRKRGQSLDEDENFIASSEDHELHTIHEGRKRSKKKGKSGTTAGAATKTAAAKTVTQPLEYEAEAEADEENEEEDVNSGSMVGVPWSRSILGGIDLMRNSRYNKQAAFTKVERERLHLTGLLPPVIEDPDRQMRREFAQMQKKSSNIEKYVFLMNLLDRNEKLFYRMLIENIDICLPIVYTPTVGLACQNYSEIFSMPRGMYVTRHDKGRIFHVLKNWKEKNIKVIVVTDGERILGLGDLGSNGMGIPVGKLMLYTALGGIHPAQCLPVTIDVGTDNESLLNDEFYMGLRENRLRGEAYDELIQEFVSAVQRRFSPQTLIQFEDFANSNAFRLLHQTRDHATCFNDDIQGTAAVTLAGIVASLRITGNALGKHIGGLDLDVVDASPSAVAPSCLSSSSSSDSSASSAVSSNSNKKTNHAQQPIQQTGAACLSDHVYVFFGAGEAGAGIAELIALAISEEDEMLDGEKVSMEKARENIWMVDSKGLIHAGRLAEKLPHHKELFAHEWTGVGEPPKKLDEIVRALKATCLVGVSAQPQTFTKQVLEQMAKNCARPIVFALSNPTSQSECTARQAYEWTQGRALFASGSPFSSLSLTRDQVDVDVVLNHGAVEASVSADTMEKPLVGTGMGKSLVNFYPRQSNNSYIFPGLGLGIIASGASNVPDCLMLEASRSLALTTSDEDLRNGSLFPPLTRVREVSARIAASVARRTYEDGLATVMPRPTNLLEYCKKRMYYPRYRHYAVD